MHYKVSEAINLVGGAKPRLNSEEVLKINLGV